MGRTVTIAIVYLMIFAELSCSTIFCRSEVEWEPPITAPRLFDWFSQMYSLCCRVCRFGEFCILIMESIKEFQCPTAPNMAMVARIGFDSGQIIFVKIVQ